MNKEFNKLFLLILISFIAVAFSTCGEKSKDSARGGPAITPTPTPTQTTTAANTTTESTLENCLSQGLAWVPTTTDFGVKHCAGRLVTDWCCNQTTIESRFPGTTEHAKIVEKFKSSEYTQLKLYSCSIENGTSSAGIPIYHIHFFGILNNVEYYKVMKLDGLSSELTNVTGKDLTPSCPNPLYSTEAALRGTATTTDTTMTSTITSTSTTITIP